MRKIPTTCNNVKEVNIEKVFQGFVSAQEKKEEFIKMKPSKMMCGKMRLASCHTDHR
jgi:hypothetical protein